MRLPAIAAAVLLAASCAAIAQETDGMSAMPPPPPVASDPLNTPGSPASSNDNLSQFDSIRNMAGPYGHYGSPFSPATTGSAFGQYGAPSAMPPGPNPSPAFHPTMSPFAATP
ncbi:MAG TPA: hypothetical protein VGH23_10790 [Rhizomicrobium sp.]|jgi:hypothetical protein